MAWEILKNKDNSQACVYRMCDLRKKDKYSPSLFMNYPTKRRLSQTTQIIPTNFFVTFS